MIHYDQKFERSDKTPPDLELLAARVTRHPHTGARLNTISLVSGGYSNINARVTFEDGGVALLRHRSSDTDILAIEAAIMKRAAEVVSTPAILASGQDWLLLEWIDGERVDTLFEDEASREHWEQLAAACGEALAKIHRLTMPSCGFFDDKLQIADALSGAGRGILDYIEQCCDHPTVRERLHPRIDAVRRHIEQHERRFTALDEQIALVHSDYNTKNLLAARDERGEWHITVLDWEFAFAGSPMMDLGNFLRFEHERPHDVARAFIRGYERERGAPLHPEWRLDARLMDLASMLSFLAREELSPRTESTALGVIDRTLASAR
mgnify:FL=1